MSEEAGGPSTGWPRNLGVLISGRGSNLVALIRAVQEQRLDARITIVISNRADAPGLDHAREARVDTLVLDHRRFASRDEYDGRLVHELHARDVSLVCLAGFMRLIGTPMLDAFPNRILNIHPSLLPAFPGVDAQRQALEHGVKVTGATVHIVTGELDGGPIVIQAAVPVHDSDTVATLADRILAAEHRIYPEGVRIVLGGGWQIEGRRFVCRAGTRARRSPD